MFKLIVRIVLSILLINAATASPNYAPAHYDSIVTSSIHGHQNVKLVEVSHGQKALVLHKPVLITSLSDKPASVIETSHAIPVTNIKTVVAARPKLIVAQRKPIISYAVRPAHSFGYAYSFASQQPTAAHHHHHDHEHVELQKVHKPFFSVGYALPHTESNVAFDTSSITARYPPHLHYSPAQSFGYAYTVHGHSEPHHVSQPAIEYGVPHVGAAHFHTEHLAEPVRTEYDLSHEHISPVYSHRPESFGYAYTIHSDAAKPLIPHYSVPSTAYGVPIVEPVKPYVPVTPATEYGVPKVGHSAFAFTQQLPFAK